MIDFELEETKYGFRWGPLEVARLISDPKWGVVVTLMTDKEELEVRCSPKGKRMTVRVHPRTTPSE